jgi:hypothetical protein
MNRPYERRPLAAPPQGLDLRPYEVAWQAPRRALDRLLMRLAIDAIVLIAFFMVLGMAAAAVLG